MNNKPYTQSEFVSKLSTINPAIEVLGEYKSSHSRILVRCKKCRNEWSPQAYRLIQHSGCPECGKRLAIENRKGKTAKKTTEQFVQELSLINNKIIIVGEYTGSKNRIDCICKVCGCQWAGIPSTLLSGADCPTCRKIERSKYRKYSPESFAEKAYAVNPEIELLSDFSKSTEKVQVKCKKCGKTWFSKAYSLLQGRGCPECSHSIGAKKNTGKTGLKSTDRFIQELAQVDNTIEVVSEYVNTHTNIECKCKRCNHAWRAKPYSLLQGHGCPKCAKSGTSFMEQLILLCFREALGNENVLSRDKSIIEMELDIVIPEFKLAIEPGNWFLHQRSVQRDEQKRLLCKEKKYRLITIYDRFPENNEPPFKDDCYVFHDDLNKTEHSVIHSLIYGLFKECGITKQFSDIEWLHLEEIAYENSKSITHEDFVKKLFTIRPDIEVLGKYKNSNRKIEVKCRKCGFTWYGVPSNLIKGDGCRKCGAKARGEMERKKQEAFEDELKNRIPTLKVIGTYINRHKQIKVQCLRCNTIWEPTPGSLLRKEHDRTSNNGCPTCTKKGQLERKVMNIDTGEVFDSAIIAAKEYGVVPSAIRQCCRGKSKTSCGYHWKYIE